MKTILFRALLLLFSISPLVNASLPPIIIYKTKADYTNLVPIALSEDGSTIISYPDPRDVFYEGQIAYPKELSQGYLLDRRGIGPNTVFLDISYEEYSQLENTPSQEEFFAMIKDYDPFLEIYFCINAPSDDGLDWIIRQGKLDKECDSMLNQSKDTPQSKQPYFIYGMGGITVLVIIILYLLFRKKK